MLEQWKEIKGYEFLYWVSNYGRIKSIKGLRKIHKNNQGYPIVTLSKNGDKKTYSVHRLVAKAFVINPDPENLTCVNHKDNNPENDYFENLEWCTMSYNTLYSMEQGRFTQHIQNCIDNCEKQKIKVCQYDLKGNLITTFNSMSEASHSVNGNKSSISKCCAGKLKSAYGFIWKYTIDK